MLWIAILEYRICLTNFVLLSIAFVWKRRTILSSNYGILEQKHSQYQVCSVPSMMINVHFLII